MNAWKWVLLGTGAALLITLYKRNEIMEAIWDQVTENRISKLHPAIRERARQFILEAQRQGIKLRITDGLRTFAEQQTIYDKGRTPESIARKESIVSNAKPGQSYHNYGLAIDVVEIKDGKGLWENPNWPKIAAIGKALGFKWGGEFTKLRDLPHFEYSGGNSIAQLLAMVNAGKVDNEGYVVTVA